MGVRRRLIALVAGLGVIVGAAAVTLTVQGSASAAVTCSGTVWAEGNTYTAGQQVTYQAHLYQALVTHTAWPGAGWNPASTPTLWKDLGACTGGGTTTPPTTPPTTKPTTPPTTPPTTTPPTTAPPTTTPPTRRPRPAARPAR